MHFESNDQKQLQMTNDVHEVHVGLTTQRVQAYTLIRHSCNSVWGFLFGI